MTQVLTIDLEDWFHSLEPDPQQWGKFERRVSWGTDRLLESLDKHSSRATFFVLGDVAEHHPELIRKIQGAGHEIGTHGMLHSFVNRQSQKEFRDDLRTSIDLLESITGARVQSYRAPYFSITKEAYWALEIIREEGLSYDSSIFPVHNPRYGAPDAYRTPHEIIPGLYEWPISTLPTPLGNLPFAGGVYFRALPWRFVLAAFERLQKHQEPILMYLHPWEIDWQQPRYRTSSRFLNLRHYWRLSASHGKLDHLLQNIRFTTLQDGFAELRKKELV